MWWPNKTAFLALLLPALLSGCGFSPVYGKKTEEARALALAGVRIDPIGGRVGQLFREHLEDVLNPSGAVPAQPAYRLTVVLSTSTSSIDTARNGTVSRYNVYINSHYTLFRIADGKQVTTGDIRQVNSYDNTITDYFSTYIAGDYAIDRGLDELGEDYRLRLSPFLTVEQSPVAPAVPPAIAPASPVAVDKK